MESLACFALFFWRGGRSLEDRDCLRCAGIGREMRETGDWTLPRINGSPHVQKPPLHFWGIARAWDGLPSVRISRAVAGRPPAMTTERQETVRAA